MRSTALGGMMPTPPSIYFGIATDAWIPFFRVVLFATALGGTYIRQGHDRRRTPANPILLERGEIDRNGR
jgi:hypothetical protein